ncbi:unnamed protein product [Ostreobium quekettii]|uniref:Uncharacterized protein n=1 Tax=Ostreobium quekettii TaxID=121088 RepID=A0A8S1IW21_9CHLO|nr:unnamed protein product [Ostreobium quekettii]|eukprot:evm.model.scf_59.5 EVM.evm.TU.scf_59.5   scf_59:36472-37887(+)
MLGARGPARGACSRLTSWTLGQPGRPFRRSQQPAIPFKRRRQLLRAFRHEMTGRYFENTLVAVDPGVAGTQASDAPTADWSQKIWGAVQESLAVIRENAGKHSGVDGGTIYCGLGGIAMMHFHMAMQCRHGLRGGRLEEKELLSQALHWSTQAEGFVSARHRRHRVTFLEGYSGILALKAVIFHYMGSRDACEQCVRELEAVNERVSVLPSGECEVLYGRCGYLFSLLFVQHHVGKQAVDGRILSRLAKHVLDEGRTMSAKMPEFASFQLMYSWHDSFYLGACHGLAGILHILLMCPSEVAQALPGGEGSALIQGGTAALVERCFPSGNLPSSLGNQEDRLVQWCHGSPGLIQLLVHSLKKGNDARDDAFLLAARRASDDVWRRGLLTKGLGLCHGMAGNGYSFLSLYRATGDIRELSRARAFAECMADNWKNLVDIPDRPMSLYEGLAGAVCFWVDVLNAEHSRFPGFEL